MARRLILFNGTWYDGRQFFIASHSRADACRLMCDALGYQIRGIDHTIAKYFHKGAWGNKMQGVIPERGVWASENMHSEPKRIV